MEGVARVRQRVCQGRFRAIAFIRYIQWRFQERPCHGDLPCHCLCALLSGGHAPQELRGPASSRPRPSATAHSTAGTARSHASSRLRPLAAARSATGGSAAGPSRPGAGGGGVEISEWAGDWLTFGRVLRLEVLHRLCPHLRVRLPWPHGRHCCKTNSALINPAYKQQPCWGSNPIP